MRIMNFMLAGLIAVHASACGPSATPVAKPTPNPVETKRLAAFFDKVFKRDLDRSPFMQAFLGIKKDQDKWNDISEEREREDMELAKSDLEQLRREIDYNKLDRQSQISYRLFEHQSQRAIDGYQWRLHNYPVNQMFGAQSRLPAFLINFHRVENATDARAYITRLEGVRALFEQLKLNIEQRERAGVMPPAFVYPKVIQDCRNIIKGAPFDESGTDSTLWADFRRKVDALNDVDQAEKDALLDAAKKALLSSVVSSYRDLIGLLERQQKLATADDGVWKLPDGDAYYDFALEGYTTTKLGADEIHQLGLDEVKRIHDEMREIMKKVGFEGDLLAFFEYMRTNKKFYYAEDEAGRKAYLRDAETIIRTMEGRLDELFITKPKAGLVVKPVEPYREKSAGKAFYNPPDMNGNRPGIYYANLYKMSDMPIYQMEALAYHEAIPGHHMQNAIAIEQDALPMFRRFGGYSAYGEGWGLYAEYLPKEMGLYTDPYSDFGRLAMELWRACRLVVDTGIHRKKWTREQAIEYLKNNTPNPDGDSIKAIERYIVAPGQATAYKVGMLEILRLRKLAKDSLGEAFDIREFHEVILTSGSVPLTILGEVIDEWIASKNG